MRLNQIKAKQVLAEVDAFIQSITQDAVCTAASSLRNGRPCSVFQEMKKGSFNLCYFVSFDDDSASAPGSEDRWVVRIPIIPRLGCPDEKLRCEIATMKYISERTTIPIPELLGYSLSTDNPIGVPFMMIKFIDGSPLEQIDACNNEYGQHILRQLVKLYLQFFKLTFDEIGSLTLRDDGAGGHTWTFGGQRPLLSTISEQELAGHNPSAIIPRDRSYKSALDFYYALTELAFNDWDQARDAAFTEKDAQDDLYDLRHFRSYVIDWVRPEHNYGPYYLMHGDLLPSNILVDSDKNFLSIIDWEWCHTVSAQLFVPPEWISGLDILQASTATGSIRLMVAANKMGEALWMETEDTNDPILKVVPKHPLGKLWRFNVDNIEAFAVAHSLLRPAKCIMVYWNLLDGQRHGFDGRAARESRVSAFFTAPDGYQLRKIISRKVEDGKKFKQEVHELGMELKERESIPELVLIPEAKQILGLSSDRGIVYLLNKTQQLHWSPIQLSVAGVSTLIITGTIFVTFRWLRK